MSPVRSPLPSAAFFHVVMQSSPIHVLLTRQDYRGCLARLAGSLERDPLRLLAYCLFSNECQFVVGPTVPGRLKRLAARVATTRRPASPYGHLQGDYRVFVRSIATTSDLVYTARGVEREGLRRRLATRAQDWPWSSLAQRLGGGAMVPLVSTPFLSSAAWIDYVNIRLSPADDLPGSRRAFSRLVEMDQAASAVRERQNSSVSIISAAVRRPVDSGGAVQNWRRSSS